MHAASETVDDFPDNAGQLIEAGWIPPPAFWLDLHEIDEGEFALVWLVEDASNPESFPEGLAFIACFQEGHWYDADGRDVEELTGYRVAKVGPEPGRLEEDATSVTAYRLLRKYLTRRRELTQEIVDAHSR